MISAHHFRAANFRVLEPTSPGERGRFRSERSVVLHLVHQRVVGLAFQATHRDPSCWRQSLSTAAFQACTVLGLDPSFQPRSSF